MYKQLLSLAAMLLCVGSLFAQVEPADGGVYYLYNAGCDAFLTRANNWGTQASTMPVGLPWKVSVADGACTLRMYDLTVAGSTAGLGTNAFCDNNSPAAFTLSGNATDGYTLANGTNYLTAAASGSAVSLSTTASTWLFLTQEQYTARLAAKAAAQEKAVASSASITLGSKSLETVVTKTDMYIATTTDDGVPTSSTWTVTGVSDRGGTQNWGTAYGAELYMGGGYYSRTITGLEQGIYKVTVRAMKRVGTNANCYTMGEAGYSLSDAYLEANGNIIPIQSWYDGCTSNGYPNSTDQFASLVSDGKYKASGFVYVGSDGNLSLNAVSEAYWDKSWFIFNGIEYTYYNKTELAEKLENCTDLTSKIINPSFEEGSLNGWTSADGGSVANNGNFAAATGSYFVEKWVSGSNTLADGTLTQTIASLPAGEYTLTAQMHNVQQGDDTDGTGFYLTLGDNQVECNSKADQTYAVSFTTTAEGDVTIGSKIASCTGNWICIDNFKLYLKGISTLPLTDEITAATALYNTFDATKDYAVALKAAIDEATAMSVGTFSVASELNDAVVVLQTAEKTAKHAYLVDNYADLDDGKYCMNIEGAWLGAANSWGTQASFISHPEYVELTRLADGRYNIKSQVSNYGDQYFNGSYMDGAATPVSILCIDGKYYVSADDGVTYCYNKGGVVGSKTEMTAWNILSIADMDARMADASENNPVDISYKILDPDFGRNNVNADSWTSKNVTWGGDNSNMLYEANSKTFSMSQTITGLPSGIYEVRSTSMYRQDGSDTNIPYMYANDVKTDFAVNTGGESTMAAAATAMAGGSYEISAVVTVTDGTINIGVTTEGTSCWAIWDNFQLYSLGGTVANMTITDAKYGTFCSPFDVAIPDGVTAYKVTAIDSNSQLELKSVASTISADTPVLVYSESTVNKDFVSSKEPASQTATAGLLTGVYADTEAAVGTYVLQNQNGNVCFYMVTADAIPTVKANRCYLTATADPGSKSISLPDDSATAISVINALTTGSATIYDTTGRRLTHLQRGINIVNGIKVNVK